MSNISWIGPQLVADDVEMCVPSKDATILDMCGGTGAVAMKVFADNFKKHYEPRVFLSGRNLEAWQTLGKTK